jgi:metallo-beta-lactamase family protein
VKLRFLGANRQVTGSRYLLEAGGLRLLVDCGLFQQREDAHHNWEPSPVAPGDVDRVLLTHAHLDHSGLLPKFVAEGYTGPVLTTPASMELSQIVLEDAARIQEEDAAYKKRRHEKEGRRGRYPEVPLYTGADAAAALRLFERVSYGEPVALNEHVRAVYHDAGHILGSAMVEVVAREDGNSRRVVFSGDIGPWTRPLSHDPTVFAEADYVVMESTYGDRDHVDAEPIPDALSRIINDVVERGGNVVIPTFAIDRAQTVLFHLGELVRARRIPRLTIFVDSPMAVDVTTGRVTSHGPSTRSTARAWSWRAPACAPAAGSSTTCGTTSRGRSRPSCSWDSRPGGRWGGRSPTARIRSASTAGGNRSTRGSSSSRASRPMPTGRTSCAGSVTSPRRPGGSF